MRHPSESTLALYAGRDLDWFTNWRMERHITHCPECRDEIAAFQAAHAQLVELDELPVVPWNRLAIEMRANIRLGLAAGECVRADGGAGRALRDIFSGARAMAAAASVAALIAASLIIQRPAPVAQVAAGEGTVLRATAAGIELNQGGRSLSLLHVRADNVSYSAGAQGSMRADYVDSDTGNVTINNLYVQ